MTTPDTSMHFHMLPRKVSIAPTEDHICPGAKSALAQDIVSEGEAKVDKYSGIFSFLVSRSHPCGMPPE